VPPKQQFIELDGFRVSVDRVVYEEDPVGPAGQPHRFVYFITIHNDSEETVSIKGRKWVVTNDQGQTVVVEGDGVVGQFPTIPPGGRFSYNSFHLLGTRRGRAEGSYFGLDGKGRRVITRIPPFDLEVPATA
jgi:ApaG protein